MRPYAMHTAALPITGVPMNKRVDHKVLAAALATPEEGIATPPRTRPTSAITQIAALEVGEHWSRVQSVPVNTPLKDYAADSVQWRDDLRNSINSSVRHAKARTGGTYTIEVGDFISPARTIYLVAIVTRTA
jgi:hypothetical protein